MTDKIIAAMLHDIFRMHEALFDSTSKRNTLRKVLSRLNAEGVGFLTKTLPRLGKAFDKALCNNTPLTSTVHRFATMKDSELPKLFGELFKEVLNPNGELLPKPCVHCVKSLRQLLYSFYKYELPYTDEQEREVVDRFKRTDQDLQHVSFDAIFQPSSPDLSDGVLDNNGLLGSARDRTIPSSDLSDPVVDSTTGGDKRYEFNWYPRRAHYYKNENAGFQNPASTVPNNDASNRSTSCARSMGTVVREARILLHGVFAHFDGPNIQPRHGPGVVATKQRLWAKYHWTNVSRRITDKYPLDAYFYASLGHVCDRLDHLRMIQDKDLPAKVILVPKDSRGPRLISCEPVDNQWVQQGLMKSIVSRVESFYAEGKPSTAFNVFFTNQQPNQFGALIGSKTGRYATLDLNEASDRVSLQLVRLLFPAHVCEYLECCRSLSTELPDGSIMPFRKFAPMGSSLCFPIMALTIWAILTAAAPDTDTQESILVYGDDVIVPTAYAGEAMKQLESFGLKINRDKSCISGFFRESCGVDAFLGEDVTPVRFRTVWSSSRSPDAYVSWIAYANHLYRKGFVSCAHEIVRELTVIYGEIPGKDMHLACPSLEKNLVHRAPTRTKSSKHLQKRLYRVWDVRSPRVHHEMDGWSMLLRYFTEQQGQSDSTLELKTQRLFQDHHSLYTLKWAYGRFKPIRDPFQVRSYTQRRSSKLVRRWR